MYIPFLAFTMADLNKFLLIFDLLETKGNLKTETKFLNIILDF